MEKTFTQAIAEQCDVRINVDERIDRIFSRLDEYIKQKSFEELTFEQVIYFVSNFAQTRRSRIELGMSRDENLYELEKDFRWLMRIMRKRNLQKITRYSDNTKEEQNASNQIMYEDSEENYGYRGFWSGFGDQ